jgi:poly-gamma-glutamate biosynthesis protein PgsC/CapC
MTELLAIAIGVSVTFSVLFTELFGIATGGLIVPGYMALYLNQPWSIVVTLATAFATYGTVRALSLVVIVYGRRRTSLMILIGYFLGMLAENMTSPNAVEYDIIGYIIPGLIAMWMDRQGVAQTLASLTIVSIVVRLVMILTVGPEVLP